MSNNPTQKDEWKILENLSNNLPHLNNLFSSDPDRFDKFSISIDGLFFDYSKQKITTEILDNLLALAKKSNIEERRNEMFSGKSINTTEDRAVLHTALRSPDDYNIEVDSKNIIPEIHETLGRIENISNKIRNGEYLGSTGKPITQIISIGIGGSDLGPRMAYEALNKGKQPVNVHFVSNIDAEDLNKSIKQCNPETTLVIVISKSFTTHETMVNALSAQQWLQDNLANTDDLSPHFIAVSANEVEVEKFGITAENTYPMWDWVNGRFSLCSSVGLPIAIGLGFDVFSDLLRGSHEIDKHFKTAPIDKNIPILMALVAIWNRNFLNCPHLAVLPYAQKLSLFPAYLQQLEMESNGKDVDLDENKITSYKTGTIIFGEAGTNGQHSFYQLFHQGSDIIPCDFIGAINPNHNNQTHHNILMTNMLAQGQSMMQGKTNTDNIHRHFDGNKPSTTILINKLDAYHLGMLIALYEHKVMIQGIIWNINSFDQFGVELGKEMALNIEENNLNNLDSSTKGLYSLIHKDTK